TYVAMPATTATIGKLTDGTSYYAVAFVENSSYYLGPSVQSPAFTPVAGPQPAPPVSASARAGDGQAAVSWVPPTEAGGSPITGYVVTAYNANNVVVGTPVTAGASATSAIVTGLTNGSTYSFSVAAANNAGAGPSTFTGSVTPA